MQVRGHQHDRYGTGDRVEQVAVRRVGPQRVAEPVPDQHCSRLGRVRPQPGGDQLRRLGRGAGRPEIEAPAGERPLVEVHVRVPQPGQQHPPVEIDDLRALRRGQVRADRGDGAGVDEDVGHRAVERGGPQQDRGVGHRSPSGGARGPLTSTVVQVASWGMAELNHTIVASPDRWAGARFLTEILGLPEPVGFGPFAVVTMANGVSLDFMESTEVVPQHYAFLVGDDEFAATAQRLQERGLPTWADPWHGQEGENHNDGGRGLYFDSPEGHNLEIITRPYGSGG